jgi:hypothetical protein
MKRIKVRSHPGLDPSFLRRLSLNPTGPLPPATPRRPSASEFDGAGRTAESASALASPDPTDSVAAGTRSGNAVVLLPSMHTDERMLSTPHPSRAAVGPGSIPPLPVST